MRVLTLTVTAAAALLIAAPMAQAAAQNVPPVVRREVRELRDAKREVRIDQAQRRDAVRDGDRAEVRQETREIREGTRDVRQERRDVKRTVRRVRRP